MLWLEAMVCVCVGGGVYEGGGRGAASRLWLEESELWSGTLAQLKKQNTLKIAYKSQRYSSWRRRQSWR